MKIFDITAFITLLLTTSIAGERLVTIIKTLVPWLESTPNPAMPVDSVSEITRKIIVMLVAFICCWFTASIINGWPPQATISVTGVQSVPTILLGLLASGGSAFWTSILGYVKTVKDIKTQKLLQEKIQTDTLIESLKRADIK